MSELNEPIDVVYTWVDGADPAHQETVANHGTSAKQKNPERFRDLFDLLKYSLRSLERYAPWINRVHLFTSRPQTPEWLNLASDRVTIHFHDEIIPEEYLPTFSSRSIESFLHLVPGLSGKFIYMNDDFLLGSPVSPLDFFTEDGRMKIYGTIGGGALKIVKDDIFYDVTSKFQHLPRLISKEIYGQMEIDWASELAVTRSHKFRTRGDVIPHTLYRYYALSRFKEECYAPSVFRYSQLYDFHKIKNNPDRQHRKLKALANSRRKFICFNDDQRDNPNEQVIEAVQSFLSTNYPNPSSFEN
ncbi:MAG: hypothetical protein GY816_15470 [Cytophagales bacterium]|nr:hypothetical protein [Cytophagales bacterium]